MKKLRTMMMIGGLSLTTAASPAQNRPAPVASPQPVTANSIVEMLDVVALDPQGRLVADLRQTDFRVIEDGKVRPITSFQASESKPPDHPAATVVLFDLLNHRAAIQDPCWNEIARAFEDRESGDRLYIYLLSNEGGLYPIHELPGSEAQDEAADPQWNRQIRPLLDDAARKLVGLKQREMAEWRDVIATTYQAIEDIGTWLAALPGRKNLIWVSHGLPMIDSGFIDLEPLLWQISEKLDRNHIAVYTVAQTAVVDGVPSVDKETLQLISGFTGGRFYPSNYVGEAITQAITDARVRYVIGYEPAPRKLDNKDHKIQVTCARKGIRIHAKEGYFGSLSRAPWRSGWR